MNKSPPPYPLNKTIRMLTIFIAGIIIGFGINQYTSELSGPEPDSYNPGISVCFTPNPQCKSKIISLIKSAKESILVQAYSFTDTEIAQELVKSHQSGISISTILDKSNKSGNHSKIDILLKGGIPVFIDTVSGIAHNKVIIIDNKIVVTGSYNFSKAAYSRNAENLVAINSPELAEKYTNNWTIRKNASILMDKFPTESVDKS
jgi:phospholipase D